MRGHVISKRIVIWPFNSDEQNGYLKLPLKWLFSIFLGSGYYWAVSLLTYSSLPRMFWSLIWISWAEIYFRHWGLMFAHFRDESTLFCALTDPGGIFSGTPFLVFFCFPSLEKINLSLSSIIGTFFHIPPKILLIGAPRHIGLPLDFALYPPRVCDISSRRVSPTKAH